MSTAWVVGGEPNPQAGSIGPTAPSSPPAPAPSLAPPRSGPAASLGRPGTGPAAGLAVQALNAPDVGGASRSWPAHPSGGDGIRSGRLRGPRAAADHVQDIPRRLQPSGLTIAALAFLSMLGLLLFWPRLGAAPTDQSDLMVLTTQRLHDETARREQAQQALYASEDRYREVVENVGCIIIKLDPNGRIISWNRVAAESFGWRIEEVLGRSLSDTIMPQTQAPERCVQDILADLADSPVRCKNPGNCARHVVENLGKNGERAWVAWTYRPILKADGQITGVLCVGANISEIREAQLKLAESEAKYRALFRDSLEPMSLTKAGKITDVNPAWLNLHGFRSPEEVIGMDVLDVLHPDDRAALVSRRQTPPEGRKRVFQVRDLRKDGVAVPVEVYSTPINLQGELTILSTVHDVSARVLKDEALHTARKDWEDIFQSISDPTMLLDPDMTILAANRALTKVLGVGAEEIVGRACHQVFHGSPCPPPICPIMHMKVTGRCEQTRFELDLFGGSFIASCTPLTDETGRIKGFLHTMIDITERKKAEEALRFSEERYRSLVEGVQGYAIFMLDPNGLVATWSEGSERIFGHAASEILGKHFSCFHTEEDAGGEKLQQTLLAAQHDGRSESHGWRLRKNGVAFWGQRAHDPLDRRPRPPHRLLRDHPRSDRPEGCRGEDPPSEPGVGVPRNPSHRRACHRQQGTGSLQLLRFP